jgi:CheY-like chemotaxis protein
MWPGREGASDVMIGDSKPQPRILLVEDEPAVRDLLRHALERRGYHVDTGCTGEEGLALCDALEPPDLLITDLIMPGAAGPIIVERMRRRGPDAKVLLLSGYAEHRCSKPRTRPASRAWSSRSRSRASPKPSRPYSTPNAKSTFPGRPIRLTYPELT